jgi:hypothetical protein
MTDAADFHTLEKRPDFFQSLEKGEKGWRSGRGTGKMFVRF